MEADAPTNQAHQIAPWCDSARQGGRGWSESHHGATQRDAAKRRLAQIRVEIQHKKNAPITEAFY
jgi:hypothetical protein